MNKPSLPQQKPMRPKTIKVSVLVPAAMFREVKKLAGHEHRSMSAQFLALAENGLGTARVSASN